MGPKTVAPSTPRVHRESDQLRSAVRGCLLPTQSNGSGNPDRSMRERPAAAGRRRRQPDPPINGDPFPDSECHPTIKPWLSRNRAGAPRSIGWQATRRPMRRRQHHLSSPSGGRGLCSEPAFSGRSCSRTNQNSATSQPLDFAETASGAWGCPPSVLWILDRGSGNEVLLPRS